MALVGYVAGIGRTYTDQDVDSMCESDAARQWEELNEADPYEKNLIAAAKTLKVADEHLDKAIDQMLSAIDEVYEIPEAVSLLSECYEELLSIKGFINRKRDDYSRGVR